MNDMKKQLEPLKCVACDVIVVICFKLVFNNLASLNSLKAAPSHKGSQVSPTPATLDFLQRCFDDFTTICLVKVSIHDAMTPTGHFQGENDC